MHHQREKAPMLRQSRWRDDGPQLGLLVAIVPPIVAQSCEAAVDVGAWAHMIRSAERRERQLRHLQRQAKRYKLTLVEIAAA